MTRSSSPGRLIPIALLLAVMAGSSGASFAQERPVSSEAQPAPLPGDTVRLTDAERQSIMATQTVDSAAAARGEMVESDRAALGIHGEVGAMIGSNGTRAAFGTAAIPLGDHAGAVISFESSRLGYRR